MSIAFETGIRALLAAQNAMHAIGQNVSNVNTEGYARRRILLSPVMGLERGGVFLGGGVELSSLDRVVDASLEARLRQAVSGFARVDVETQFLSGLESLLDEPSSTALGTLMSEVFASFSQLSQNPTDGLYQAEVVRSAESMASAFRSLRRGTNDLRAQLGEQIANDVRELDAVVQELGSLGQRVRAAEASGREASDVRDRIGVLAERAAELAGVETRLVDGALSVTLEGRELLAGRNTVPVTFESVRGSERELRVGGSPVTLRSGRLAGLTGLWKDGGNVVDADLDRLAAQWILEVNRRHARSVSGGEGYEQLISTHTLRDGDGDGNVLDELLTSTGLPFAMRAGQLVVRVVDSRTGDSALKEIAVDPDRMTVDELVQALDGVDHLAASVDTQGLLVLRADASYRFDFTGTLDATPDTIGSFGGSHATLTARTTGPFALSVPADFQIEVDGGPPVTVSLDASMFADPSNATAEEVRHALQGQLSNVEVLVENGRLVLRNPSQGVAASLRLTDGTGTPLSALGLPPGPEFGFDVSAAARISGTYDGSENHTFSFVAESDGLIGGASPVVVSVFDERGTRVATLDLGAPYEPGTPLDVAHGIEVTFDAGFVSKTAGDRFEVFAAADSDTIDLLPAFGLGAFFTGHDAATIAVREDLVADPTTIGFTLPGSTSGDGGLLGLLALERASVTELGDRSLTDFYRDLVTDVAFDVRDGTRTLDARQGVLDDLRLQRESVSGVSLDEELANLVRFEDAYAAATRYLQTIESLNQDLMDLLG